VTVEHNIVEMFGRCYSTTTLRLYAVKTFHCSLIQVVYTSNAAAKPYKVRKVSAHPMSGKKICKFLLLDFSVILNNFTSMGVLWCLICSKIVFGRCSALDPAVEAYEAPQTP